MIIFSDYFYYDESSPSCLRWKIDIGTKIKAHTSCGTLKSDLHWRVTVSGKHYYCHRIIWELLNGAIEEGFVIDHLSGDSKDNRIINLRKIEYQDNTRNAKLREDSTTGIKGVSILKNIDRNGNAYLYVSAYYQRDGKRFNKRFSVKEFGMEKAINKACQWRTEQLLKLREMGYNYTDRHIFGD